MWPRGPLNGPTRLLVDDTGNTSCRTFWTIYSSVCHFQVTDGSKATDNETAMSWVCFLLLAKWLLGWVRNVRVRRIVNNLRGGFGKLRCCILVSVYYLACGQRFRRYKFVIAKNQNCAKPKLPTPPLASGWRTLQTQIMSHHRQIWYSPIASYFDSKKN